MAGLHDRLLVIDGLIFNSDGGCADLKKGNYAACNPSDTREHRN